MMKKGILFIVSAPSGAGKTSLINALIKKRPKIQLSVSYTTRPKRPIEQPGVDYHFITIGCFRNMIEQDQLLEYAEVFGHHYGTSKVWVDRQLALGKHVLLEIDWQGAQKITKQYPEAVSIFIIPPSYTVLLDRLCTRGQDDHAIIAKRIKTAKEDMSHYTEYKYVIINDKFEHALENLVAIIDASCLQLSIQRPMCESILDSWFIQSA